MQEILKCYRTEKVVEEYAKSYLWTKDANEIVRNACMIKYLLVTEHYRRNHRNPMNQRTISTIITMTMTPRTPTSAPLLLSQ